jgi:hypothetical protein
MHGGKGKRKGSYAKRFEVSIGKALLWGGGEAGPIWLLCAQRKYTLAPLSDIHSYTSTPTSLQILISWGFFSEDKPSPWSLSLWVYSLWWGLQVKGVEEEEGGYWYQRRERREAEIRGEKEVEKKEGRQDKEWLRGKGGKCEGEMAETRGAKIEWWEVGEGWGRKERRGGRRDSNGRRERGGGRRERRGRKEVGGVEGEEREERKGGGRRERRGRKEVGGRAPSSKPRVLGWCLPTIQGSISNLGMWTKDILGLLSEPAMGGHRSSKPGRSLPFPPGRESLWKVT